MNKKHLKNVGPICHCEPPHAHSPGVASGTVACRLHIVVHDNNDNAWQRGPLWPHGMGPIKSQIPPTIYPCVGYHWPSGVLFQMSATYPARWECRLDAVQSSTSHSIPAETEPLLDLSAMLSKANRISYNSCYTKFVLGKSTLITNKKIVHINCSTNYDWLMHKILKMEETENKVKYPQIWQHNIAILAMWVLHISSAAGHCVYSKHQVQDYIQGHVP